MTIETYHTHQKDRKTLLIDVDGNLQHVIGSGS